MQEGKDSGPIVDTLEEGEDGAPKAMASGVKDGAVANTSQRFLPFEKALEYARSLKFKTTNEWAPWSKSGARPGNIPSNPHTTYKLAGWQGYGHWLGTGNLVGVKQGFLPFKEALLYARSLKLKGNKEWREWHKSSARPANIPTGPETVYKHDGWQGYSHWLGTAVLAGNQKKFLPFMKALEYARSLKFSTVKEWHVWSKSGARPGNIPSNPHTNYKIDGWQGYGHWLGTGTKADIPVGGKDGTSTSSDGKDGTSKASDGNDGTPKASGGNDGTSKDGEPTGKASDGNDGTPKASGGKDGTSKDGVPAPDTGKADPSGPPKASIRHYWHMLGFCANCNLPYVHPSYRIRWRVPDCEFSLDHPVWQCGTGCNRVLAVTLVMQLHTNDIHIPMTYISQAKKPRTG